MFRSVSIIEKLSVTHLGNILDQAPDLELLSHGEESGDVRSGDRHLSIIHEVNNARNVIQVDILGHHDHWVRGGGA